MGAVWTVIKFLNNVWAAVKLIMSQLAEARQAKREKNLAELEKAVDDAKKATTPEEAFDAQRRIVDHEP